MRALTDRKGCRVVLDRCTARVKAFCVGQAKSGTASIVGLLSANYRVAHEPERAATLDLILHHAHGEISEAAIREHRVRPAHTVAMNRARFGGFHRVVQSLILWNTGTVELL